MGWVLDDCTIKHGYGAYYQPGKGIEVCKINEQIIQSSLAADESFYQRLWQTYFSAATIRERKNRRLHLQHIPLRYWQYLTEKQIIF
ncbi:DUF4130 domain-containing protein [Suttonella ornithocola]|uniref:DUF4130 domain-containing protein n=1 Tax=Suttonella ornithocola TaxID=279832 RepID=UPI000932B3FD|nr:DUF4130 domain-containing protein [Suttonella ornithocola]